MKSPIAAALAIAVICTASVVSADSNIDSNQTPAIVLADPVGAYAAKAVSALSPGMKQKYGGALYLAEISARKAADESEPSNTEDYRLKGCMEAEYLAGRIDQLRSSPIVVGDQTLIDRRAAERFMTVWAFAEAKCSGLSPDAFIAKMEQYGSGEAGSWKFFESIRAERSPQFSPSIKR